MILFDIYKLLLPLKIALAEVKEIMGHLIMETAVVKSSHTFGDEGSKDL